MAIRESYSSRNSSKESSLYFQNIFLCLISDSSCPRKFLHLKYVSYFSRRTTPSCEAITRSTDNREINVIAGETDDVPSFSPSSNNAVQSRSVVSDSVVEETKSVIPETQPANDSYSIIDDLI